RAGRRVGRADPGRAAAGRLPDAPYSRARPGRCCPMSEPLREGQAESSWGLTVPLTGVPLADHPELYRRLPDWGYTDVWSAEVAGADAFTPLALAAVAEPRLSLGTAIVPVFTRGPALIAQSAAALAAAAPGRFSLGLGASSPAVVEQWNGLAFDRPA